MGKKLAFWGDCNGYGYKIIRILEELGGVNVLNYNASEVTSLYYIDEKNHIKGIYNGNLDREKYVIMTYHDFISKYPHQIGDTVYSINTQEKGNIIEIAWDEKREEMKYYIDSENTISWMYADEIFSYVQFNDKEECGISLKSSKMKNVLTELLEHIKNTSKAELEREFKEIESEGWTDVGPTVEEFMDFCNKVNKKPKYPKTYKECAKIMNCPIDGPSGWLFNFDANIKNTYYRKIDILMGKFIRLRICRDAYWKIAGEEMGLDKPWEPQFGKYILYSIKFYLYQDSFVLHKGEYSSSDNCVLVFPTEEIRDTFYDNFKDLIEQCKELL